MSSAPLFPDFKRVLRNCIVVGVTAAVANLSTNFPPSIEMFYAAGMGFLIAFGVEFVHAYKKMPKPRGHHQKITTFFL